MAKVDGVLRELPPGACFSKVPGAFRARKSIRKTTTCLFSKAGLFICCIGNKNKNNCKVSCLETPSFWRYKENYVTRNTPEKFRDFRETGPRTVGRLRTAEWRKNVARHRAFPVSRDTFFVILPSSAFQPSCCVSSLISNQIRFWFSISGKVPNIRWTWLDFVDLDARITWPCLRIRWMKLTFVTRILHHLAFQEFRTEQRAFNTLQLIPMKWRHVTAISRLKQVIWKAVGGNDSTQL